VKRLNDFERVHGTIQLVFVRILETIFVGSVDEKRQLNARSQIKKGMP